MHYLHTFHSTHRFSFFFLSTIFALFTLPQDQKSVKSVAQSVIALARRTAVMTSCPATQTD